MAWGILDRFMRPKWLLDRILLVAENVAESDGQALPTLLIEALRDHFGARHVCIHFADLSRLRRDARDALIADCPAMPAGAAGTSGPGTTEAKFWQLALSTGNVVTASTLPAALQDELRPLLKAAGARDGMAIPLIYRGHIYAVVNLYFKRTVPSKLATAENVMRSIRLLGNLLYGVVLQDFHASELVYGNEFDVALAQAVATRDGYAAGHVAWVCSLAGALAEAAGLSETEEEAVRRGAAFRDIGKVHVPDYILQKPGPLTAAERALVHEHPLAGERILLEAAANAKTTGNEVQSLAAAAVRSHHERLDGSGYPDGLAGADVPTVARIVAIADVYAALTADRPYRAALPVSRANQVLREMAGSALDPELVALFLARDIPAAGSAAPSGQRAPAKESSNVA